MVAFDDVEPGADYHLFSASQIDTFLDCRRKWAWDKIARIPRPSNSGAVVGDRVHHQLEDYLDGKPLDFAERVNGVKIGDVCASGVHLLPAPCAPASGPETKQQRVDRHARHGMVIEGEFFWKAKDTNFVYLGRKDLEVVDSGTIPGLAEEFGLPVDAEGRTGVPAIVDHKSTSSFGWAKTSDDLEWDVQANLYAFDLIFTRRSDFADLDWTYYATKGAKASKRVHRRVSREQAVEKFGLIQLVAKDMATIRNRRPRFDNAPRDGIEGPPDMGREWHATNAAFVEGITPNGRACEKYGGCAYRHMCRLTPAEGAFSFMSNSNAPDPLFDSLRKRAANQDGVKIADKPAELPPTCAPENVPAPEAPPAWATATEDPLRKKPRAAAPATPPTTPAPDATATDTTVAINPPESALPVPTLPPPPAEVAPATPPTASEEPAKKKRGRPAGSKNAPKDPTGADAAMHTTPKPVDTVSDTAAQAAADAAVKKCETPTATDAPAVTASGPDCTAPGDAFEPCEESPAALAFDLYLDCIPIGLEGAVLLEDYLHHAQEIVRSETEKSGEGVADYRFIAYGAGPGALAIALMAALRADPPAALIVRTQTAEAYAVLGTITKYASRVIQAIR